MATVLENYYALRGELEQRMAQAPINAVDLWYYGEIVYRVGVLETCQMYLRSAPVSMNTPELLGHYQMMDAYVQSLALERRYGPDRGPDTQKEREAAQSIRRVNSYRSQAAVPFTGRRRQRKIINMTLPLKSPFPSTFKIKRPLPALSQFRLKLPGAVRKLLFTPLCSMKDRVFQ